MRLRMRPTATRFLTIIPYTTVDSIVVHFVIIPIATIYVSLEGCDLGQPKPILGFLSACFLSKDHPAASPLLQC